MDADSPHFRWDPNSIGWLHRRLEEGEQVTAHDVARIVENNAALVSDPVLRDLVVRACRGELKKRPGRPRDRLLEHRLMLAELLSEELAARYADRKSRWKREGVSRPRGDLSPTDRAHAVVARLLGFSSLEVLRNALSSRKSRLKGLRARWKTE